jgi:hypothetical protein
MSTDGNSDNLLATKSTNVDSGVRFVLACLRPACVRRFADTNIIISVFVCGGERTSYWHA